ncbi:MAG: ABC transporter permease [Lautropia sp.]
MSATLAFPRAMRAARVVLRSPTGTLGISLLILFVLAVLILPELGIADPIRGNLLQRMRPPTLSWTGLGAHPLGTDQLGRDVFSRIVYGGRITLLVGLAAVALGAAVGVAFGVVAGFFGGVPDRILMRLADMQLSIPLLLLALIVIAVLGPGLRNLILVIALVSWVRYARVVRGQVLSLREHEFIQSARALGANSLYIMTRHVLPNVATPIMVVATLELARVIILEASLSFLGLGVGAPTPSWGAMLADGRRYISTAWWIGVFPGLAILLTVLAVNLTGDWLRDHFDPKLRK